MLARSLLALFLTASGVAAQTVSFHAVADADTPIPFTPALAQFWGGSTSQGFGAFRGIGGGYQVALHTNALSFTKLADTDTLIPDGTGAFTVIGEPSLSHLRGAFRGQGAGLQDGIYMSFGGPAPWRIADRTTPSPNGQGPFNIFRNPALDVDPITETGMVAFAASTQKFVSGVYAWNIDGSSGQTIADGTMEMPGIPGAFFTGFSDVAANDGAVAFRGSSVFTGNVAVYAWTGPGGLQVIADTTTAIPGGSGSFTGFGASFEHKVLATADGNVAFRGDGVGQMGVYLWADGQLETIADMNTPVPDSTGTFVFFFDIAPAVSGSDVLFFGVDGNNDAALYGRIDGSLVRIIGADDQLDGKTIANVTNGPEAFDAGVIMVRVIFADGTQAIYQGVVDNPPSSAADIDGDGVVNVADLVGVISAWGTCPPPPDACPEDVNGDGVVDVLDLLAVILGWGPVGGGIPSNDECGGAIDIQSGATLFSTFGATPSGVYVPDGSQPGFPSSWNVDCDQGAGDGFENDVWFRYVVPDTTGVLSISTCSATTDFDTRLAVYRKISGDGCEAGNLEGLGCNDDAPGCDGGSTVSLIVLEEEFAYVAEPGEELLIRLGSREPAQFGSGALLVAVEPLAGAETLVVPHVDDVETFYVGVSGPDGDEPPALDLTPNCGDLDLVATWAWVTAPTTEIYEVETYMNTSPGQNSPPPVTLAVYDVNGTMLGCGADTGTGNDWYQVSVHIPAVVGQRYLVRTGFPQGFQAGFIHLYVRRLGLSACGWPSFGPCTTDNRPLAGCSDGVCCNLVCGLDAYCCNVEWDGQCADQAGKMCVDPAPACELPGAHSCYVADPAPGCDDPACCESVCSVDPFCCDFEWDAECVALTATLCAAPACGAITDQSCFAPSIFPGCNDPACCGAVCNVMPFCCNVDWNQACADLALELCAP